MRGGEEGCQKGIDCFIFFFQFGFAVVPQGDIDLGASLEMPEYSFLNHLTTTSKLFKFADDCLSSALQDKREPVYNLLLYKVKYPAISVHYIAFKRR